MKHFFISIWIMFTDPIYSVSVFGSIFACIALSWIGVLYFLRKNALVGEVVAHSAFPGLILGALLGIFLNVDNLIMSLFFIFGALITSYLSMKKLVYLQEKVSRSADSSLMMSISTYLGVGVLLASFIQSINPRIYNDLIIFLYGRTATMLYMHSLGYFFITSVLLILIIIFFNRIKIFEFDKTYASFLGMGKYIENMILWISLLVIVVSLRTCGVLLISGMMVAPAVASRFWVKRVSSMLGLASLFAAFSALIGNYFSVYLGGENIVLPTGPMITIISASITVFSLFLGPQNGLLLRLFRRLSFSIRCHEENILKALYKKDVSLTCREMKSYIHSGRIVFLFVLLKLRKKVALEKGFILCLNESGRISAERIIRLHRIWEVYLHKVGFCASRVHVFAEEIEHILTDDMEKMLVEQLGNPTHCPHKKRIPSKKDVAYEYS